MLSSAHHLQNPESIKNPYLSACWRPHPPYITLINKKHEYLQQLPENKIPALLRMKQSTTTNTLSAVCLTRLGTAAAAAAAIAAAAAAATAVAAVEGAVAASTPASAAAEASSQRATAARRYLPDVHIHSSRRSPWAEPAEHPP